MSRKTGTKKNQTRLGNLISALYEEAEKMTGNPQLQTYVVCYALKDMQRPVKKRTGYDYS